MLVFQLSIINIGDWFIEITLQKSVCVPIYLYISQHEWILKSCLANKNVHLVIWKVDVTHTYVNINEEPAGFAVVKEWCDRKTS